jgi:predicted GIY-YIG superfamily endonuclease
MEKIDELIENYFYYYNEYIENTIDYPDLAKDDYNSFVYTEYAILNYFGIKKQKHIRRVLYDFISESCYENRIEYSKELSLKIIATMEKLKQIQECESGFGKYFKSKLQELNDLNPVEKSDLPNSPGIYIFYKHGEPIYVGRTNKLKERVQMHVRPSSNRDTATFAFNLSKIEYVKKYGAIKMKRIDFENNIEFKELFVEKKKYLSDCKFKYLVEENDVLQTMLEPYLAYKLGTYPILNTFENH